LILLSKRSWLQTAKAIPKAVDTTYGDLPGGNLPMMSDNRKYFALREVPIDLQKACGVDELQSLEEEISWLTEFEIPTSSEYAESHVARCLDNTLLTGHLRLISTLVASPKVDKKDVGKLS